MAFQNGHAVSTASRHRRRFKRWVSTICARDLHTSLNAANPSSNRMATGGAGLVFGFVLHTALTLRQILGQSEAGDPLDPNGVRPGSFETGLSNCTQVALVVEKKLSK